MLAISTLADTGHLLAGWLSEVLVRRQPSRGQPPRHWPHLGSPLGGTAPPRPSAGRSWWLV